MDHVYLPSEEVWESRKDWYEAHIFHYEELASYMVGDQASALLFDVQSCFCAGAWASVVIIAFAVIEANLIETGGSPGKTNSARLLQDAGFDQRFQDLRKARNRLVHATSGAPAITIDQQYDERDLLESKAREAVALMFEAFYSARST